MSITPILQFGTSRFLQAHADLFISEALSRGEAMGPITVVQSSGDASRRARLMALAAPGGYPVRVEGIEKGRPVSRSLQVTSVARALATESDWPEIARIAAEEAEVILSNTGDSGWTPSAEDSAAAFRQGMSYPAKLTQLLLARFRAGRRGIVVMPTELVTRNGDRLMARVLELARPLDAGLADWVAGQVIFANSLVDRIVSESLEPAGAVAEPYALWAVEDCPGLRLPCRHPALQVVADLNRIERLKLHILNLGHSYLVANCLARGGDKAALVRDEMADPAILADLAGRLTLLARSAEARLLPLCWARGTSLVLGGIFNSGILATGPVQGAHFDYAPASPEVLARTGVLKDCAHVAGFDLATAALRFAMTHPKAASALIGTARTASLDCNLDAAEAYWPAAADAALLPV